MAWTTADLIEAVRRRAQVPDASGGPSDTEILAIATEEIVTRFAALVRSTRENFLVTSEDVTITGDTQRYRIPRRAHGSALRDVWLITPAGRARSLLQLSLTDGLSFVGDTGEPSAYYLRGEEIVLLPTPGADLSGYSLRLHYYRRPSRLVAATDCAAVASIASQAITVDAVPSAWGSAESVDLVQAEPPFDALVTDAAATIAGSVVTMPSSADLTVAAEGDYVCLAGETCVPQIPDAFWSALVSATTVQLLIEDADRAGASAEAAQRDQLVAAAMSSIQPRVDGRAKAIINRGSILRRGWSR